MSRPRRFDNDLMQPPVAGALVDGLLLERLLGWCEAGALPQMTLPLSVASVLPHAGLDAVACELDGSHALARLNRWQGLAWRLQILLRDRRHGRGLRRGDPWDCGWWRGGSLATASAFRPRRPTLLLVREPGPAVAGGLLAALQAQSPAYAKPLRVLVVSAAPVPGMPRL